MKAIGRETTAGAGAPGLVFCVLKDRLASDALAAALARQLALAGRKDLWVSVADDAASAAASDVALLITDYGESAARRFLGLTFPGVPLVLLSDRAAAATSSCRTVSPRERIETLSGVVEEMLPAPKELPREDDRRSGLRRLSPRLLRVATQLAAGRPLKQIAASLGVSRRTVENLKYSAIREAGVATAAELVRLVIEDEAVSGEGHQPLNNSSDSSPTAAGAKRL